MPSASRAGLTTVLTGQTTTLKNKKIEIKDHEVRETAGLQESGHFHPGVELSAEFDHLHQPVPHDGRLCVDTVPCYYFI